MAKTYKFSETTISMSAVIFIMVISRSLILGNEFLGDIFSDIILAFLLVLAGKIVLQTAKIIKNIAAKEENMSDVSEKLIFWTIIIFGGLWAYRRFEFIYNPINDFLKNNIPFMEHSMSWTLSRLIPFEYLAGYVWVFYIAVLIMVACGFFMAILDTNTTANPGIMHIFSYIKPPVVLCTTAVLLSFAEFDINILNLHFIWFLLLILALFMEHNMLFRAMKYITFSKPYDLNRNRRGFKLYFSISSIIDAQPKNQIDKIIAFSVSGLALLMQAVLLVTTVVYLVLNFGILRQLIFS
ncbi:MAG: hypothetical protein FWD01_00080 [Defluviitaleaceae bacterium]|nr:hypothetical protein [Defluviitaleaceae bacterium]